MLEDGRQSWRLPMKAFDCGIVFALDASARAAASMRFGFDAASTPNAIAAAGDYGTVWAGA
jgi:hypothetical protein